MTPHSDGDAYEEDAAILTLRGRAMIEFWPSEGASGGDEGEGEPVVSFVLEPRSLLMYRGDAYRLRHGIRERRRRRGDADDGERARVGTRGRGCD